MIFDSFIINNCIYIENSNLVLNYTGLNIVCGLPIWFDFIIFFYPKDLSVDILFELFMLSETLTIIEDDLFDFNIFTENFKNSNYFDWFYRNLYHLDKYIYVITVELVPKKSLISTIWSHFFYSS